MKWQKARIMHAGEKRMIGREVWVRCGTPEPPVSNAEIAGTGRTKPVGQTLQMNLSWHGRRLSYPTGHLELLAEFADDVTIIDHDEWYRQ